MRSRANQSVYRSAIALLSGFAVGSIAPVLFGIQWLIQEINYEESLPKGPNIAQCGMGRMGAILMIAIVGPTCGVIGAWTVALWLWITSERPN